MNAHTPADLIGQYIKLRNYIAAETRAFNDRMAPYEKAMEALEAHFTGVAVAEVGPAGKWSLATPKGTAFRKLNVKVSVDNREEYMDFLFDGRREGFITNHVAKEPVLEYLEQFKAKPPGVKVTSEYAIQFNSPKGSS